MRAVLGTSVVVARDVPALDGDLAISAATVDDAVATSYGQLAAAVVAARRQPRARTMDLLIAATAHAHDARLCTRNAADLRGVEHLVEVVAV